MNRRIFATSIASGLAVIGSSQHVMAQRKKPIVSKLTGAEVDFADTNFEFDDHRVTVTGGNQVEYISLKNDNALLSMQFMSWKPRLDSGGQYDVLVQQLEDYPDVSDIDGLGHHILPDGAWMAYSYTYVDLPVSIYWEVQHDAFADVGVDLWIQLQVFDNEIEAALEDTQAVQLAGMTPLLFMDDSSIAAELFDSTADGTGVLTGLGDRGSRTAKSGDENQSTLSNGDVVQDVLDHQQQYHDEFDQLYEALEIATDTSVADEEEMGAIATIMEIAASWQEYPISAGNLDFAREFESLETAYLVWADSVSVLGDALLNTMLGTASGDEFSMALDATSAADRLLSSELRNLGAFPSAMRSRSFTLGAMDISHVPATSVT